MYYASETRYLPDTGFLGYLSFKEEKVDIKILGPGCPNCKKVEALAHEAASELGIEAHFEKITDMGEITKYPILRTPGLVVNGKVVSSGRIPTRSEIVSWLATAMAQEK